MSIPGDGLTQWMLAGNSGTDPAFDFLGTADSEDLVFRTDDTPWMRLMTNGWLGVNTASPSGRFHIANGSILATGTTGTNPDLGAGTRLMWIPDQAAFRAGGVDGTQWDGADLGNFSFAAGLSNIASGEASTVFGIGNIGEGNATLISGNENFIATTATFSTAFGDNNSVSAPNSMAAGVSNEIQDGSENMALGFTNIIDGDNCFALGMLNQIDNDAIVCGALGKGILLSENFTFGMGCFLEGTAVDNITLGSGLGTGNEIENDLTHSLMVGFNSDVPSLLVTGGSGSSGTYGEVGIGIDFDPNYRLQQNSPASTANYHQWTITSTTGTASTDGLRIGLDASGNAILDLQDATTYMAFETNVGEAMRIEPGGDVGIGTTNPTARLHVNNTTTSTQINTIAVQSNGINGFTQNGVFVRALGGNEITAAIRGETVANANAATGSDELLLGASFGASTTDGTDYTGYENVYGIYATTTGSVGGTNYVAGYFNGDVVCVDLTETSDENLKNNIEPLIDGLTAVMALAPKIYEFDTEGFPSMNLPSGERCGLIAQDIEQILPSLVKTSSQPAVYNDTGELVYEQINYKSVNYVGIIPYLIKAIQEQQEELEELHGEINSCCSENRSFVADPEQHTEVVLRSVAMPVLYQNTPNPHKGECTIRYFLPHGISGAEIQFLDSRGIIINTVSLTQTGSGQVSVQASDLAAGIYTYALVVEGQVIDVKKMMKE